MIAYRVAWEITRNPDTTVLYISSTSNLAEKQLKAVKDILTCNIYRRYWPEMINLDEGKRERWTATEISVDHPKRKEEGVRDPTIFTAGLTTTITGLHCDIAVLDDVVVKENAYTEDGREKVREQYSLLSSIENADSQEWIVGTRYHPKDLYQDLLELEEELYDSTGNLSGSKPIYEIFERKVEEMGDGTGEFLWPRQRRSDGKWFGFDIGVLSRKRAQYIDKTQYRAQYYNDPNSADTARIASDKFQYYDRKFVTQEEGFWYHKDKRLNIFAAIDFAFSLRKKSDYTAIVVIGVDSDNNIFILEIDRFKTDRIKEYFEHLLLLHSKWGFNKLKAEVSVAQKVIVKDLKENYIKPFGLSLSIEESNPTRHEGTKEERIAAILEPKYDNNQMWHYKGGNCQVLEEELAMAHPPHDDVKDALAAACEIAIAPRFRASRMARAHKLEYNNRFGGVSYH